MKKIILTTAVALAAFSTVKSQVTTHLQAQYLFDGNLDDSHNSNDLTSSGGFLTFANDRLSQFNSSYSFGGGTELISPVDLSALPAKSISLWFITTQPGGLIGHDGIDGNAPILYIGSGGKLRGKFWDGGQGSVSSSSQVLTDSIWHHVVITAGPNGQRAYVDNQFVGSTNTAPTVLTLDNTTIGNVIASSWPSAPNNTFFNGSIDDVRIYDTVIPPSTVNILYNTPVWQSPFDLDTIYVNQNATGANDGTSWVDAYTDARDAFVNTTQNEEIWIAEGTYKRNSSDRNITFGWVKDSVRVYGGFVGNETIRSQRDWNANPTIFSGDIGAVGDSSDNAYTTFIGPIGDLNYALIDGVKITGGNSDDNNYPNINTVGGGMLIDTEVDKVVIRNVEFYNNYAKQGGAISAYGASGDECRVTLENVVAHHNTGKSSAFGHFRASNVAPIILEMTNCLIYENNAVGSAEDFGTVLFLGGNANAANVLDATITNCTFADNNYLPGNSSKGMIRVYNQTNAPSILQFTNNICFGNNILEITENNGSNVSNPFPTVILDHNILENGLDFNASTNNNTLTSDPMFNNDYSLQVGSPAIDAGTQAGITVLPLDLAGNNRVFGTEIDLGAVEYETVAVPSNINEKLALNLSIYPNPSTSLVSIKGALANEIVGVNVYNLNGQMVLDLQNANTFDVSNLNKGVYFVSIQTIYDTYNLKLIKE